VAEKLKSNILISNIQVAKHITQWHKNQKTISTYSSEENQH